MVAKEYRGNVVSSADGEPLTGAVIAVTGTTTAVTADLDGNWSLDIPDNAESVTVTYLGMQPLEIKVKDLSPNWNDLKMDEVKTELNEVVVTGFRNSPVSEMR